MLAVSLVWLQHATPSPADMENILDRIETVIDLRHIYVLAEPPNGSQRPNTLMQLRGMICYYGMHYVLLFYQSLLKYWMLYDDSHIRKVGDSWMDVSRLCISGRFRPSVLLFQQGYAQSLAQWQAQMLKNRDEIMAARAMALLRDAHIRIAISAAQSGTLSYETDAGAGDPGSTLATTQGPVGEDPLRRVVDRLRSQLSAHAPDRPNDSGTSGSALGVQTYSSDAALAAALQRTLDNEATLQEQADARLAEQVGARGCRVAAAAAQLRRNTACACGTGSDVQSRQRFTRNQGILNRGNIALVERAPHTTAAQVARANVSADRICLRILGTRPRALDQCVPATSPAMPDTCSGKQYARTTRVRRAHGGRAVAVEAEEKALHLFHRASSRLACVSRKHAG